MLKCVLNIQANKEQVKTCIWSSEEMLLHGENSVGYKRTFTAQATTDWSFFRKRKLVQRGFDKFYRRPEF